MKTIKILIVVAMVAALGFGQSQNIYAQETGISANNSRSEVPQEFKQTEPAGEKTKITCMRDLFIALKDVDAVMSGRAGFYKKYDVSTPQQQTDANKIIDAACKLPGKYRDQKTAYKAKYAEADKESTYNSKLSRLKELLGL